MSHFAAALHNGYRQQLTRHDGLDVSYEQASTDEPLFD